MIKALFFDIDGTLVSFNTHEIPESTVKAIKMAKANGVKVFISTGRPKAFISSLDSIEPYIDGYITNNGACSFIGNDVINSNPITPGDVDTIYNYAIGHNAVEVDAEKRIIRFSISMDESSSVMDFMEIYLSRIQMCEEAANFLGCRFELVVNGTGINRVPQRN